MHGDVTEMKINMVIDKEMEVFINEDWDFLKMTSRFDEDKNLNEDRYRSEDDHEKYENQDGDVINFKDVINVKIVWRWRWWYHKHEEYMKMKGKVSVWWKWNFRQRRRRWLVDENNWEKRLPNLMAWSKWRWNGDEDVDEDFRR